MPSPERSATCGGCGLVCDDITAVVGEGGALRVDRTCPLGDAWFSERVGAAPPLARIDGREAELDAALDEAAAILAERACRSSTGWVRRPARRSAPRWRWPR